MKKINGIFMSALVAALALSACGGGGGGGGGTTGGGGGGGGGTTPTWVGTPITSPTVSPVVSFTQSIVSDGTSSYYEIFPGQANVWSLDRDFALLDGFGNQFFYAIALSTGLTGTTFPIDQVYSELSFYTPYMGISEGVTVAAASDGKSTGLTSLVTGSYSAFLNATSDSRLQQTLDLTSLPTGTIINLSLQDAVSTGFGGVDGYNPGYRVVIRDLSGNLLKVLNMTPPSPTILRRTRTAVLTEFAGQRIVLSIELHSAISPFQEGTPPVPPLSKTNTYAIIDEVMVRDVRNTNHVLNGNFENGLLTPWTTNTPQEVQNVTSGSRNLDGLDVKRSFYTVPNKLWGRWVDVFSNNTGAPISKDITYETSLGSNGGGLIYHTPGTIVSSGTPTVSKAITSWDAMNLSRDIGWVFGNAKDVTFTSYDPSGPTVGSDIIQVVYTVTVPAGGSKAIVNFIVMDGTATGSMGDPNAKATTIDTAAAAIVNDFRSATDVQYRTGMTQQQIDAVVNF